MKITIINGPNLNLLGTRETDIYGSQNFDSYLDSLKSSFPNITFDYFQSNIEGEIINHIHESKDCDGIILNAAAYTHTSVGIADAVKSIDSKVIEVHISNTYSREEFRHNSFLSPVVNGIIIGFGLDSYRLAIESLIN
ncbi:MAG: type II 3-dehydroquinate dehydratase [Candidatus Marisimplicoccus sp.]|jgi:3-dehydroquinate dehydratase-2|nr:3-dehydroquinate dehydratase [Flavobacteriaceae bacterium]MDA9883026.1 3-dehydroquinate dehydratase [Flavobacteriaceae bacterium]MDC1009955.1 3-dehydroquinate dehydratase [Flavobacteriaceae bacterium]MDC1034088.1 3-dehydroquinate dehydratase [Flavobacteriaceae bacterium]RZP01285.1 MAG: 3-dehydroquinate dehydratase [Flavobacteriales bacterium]|tara:strand:+ start:18931 stop:19344 length:414 start_codon:yes stop_codon:yes gene_type:complete